MKEKIIEGLLKLDVQNDNHWTADGLPKIDALKFTVGPTLTRDDVNLVAPGFTRSNPVVEEVQDELGQSTVGTEKTEPEEMVETPVPAFLQPEINAPVVEDTAKAQDDSTTVGRLTLHVACDVDTVFQYLAKELPDVNIIMVDDADLTALEEELRVGMAADNVLLSAVSKLMEQRNAMHTEAVAEIERRKPKSHLADQLSAFRESMRGGQHVVNRPRMVMRNGIKSR